MEKSLLAAALEYAARGWPVFPCKLDKTPYTQNGVLDATTREDQIRSWWEQWPEANVAMDVGGAGMMVLDLDPGHDMKELEKNVGKLPPTQLVASTPRGGKHLYFSIDESEIVAPSTSRLAHHVDVRSFHSYVLLHPSKTGDGAYKWASQGAIAFRSDEMLRLSNTGRKKHEDRDEWTIEPDLPENVAQATDWLLNTAKIATEGEGGDHCAYATAAMCKSYGISEATAFDLIWEHWNPRCKPPWGEDEQDHLQNKIKNAYEYNTSPPGNLTPAYQQAKLGKYFQVIHSDIPSGEETRIAGFRFADRAALQHVKTPEWIITDFIPDESYAMLFGTWGTFKTFLALDLAMRIACECQPVDELWQAPKQGAVLFAAGEGRSNLAKRVQAWEQVHNEGEEVPLFTLVDPVPTISISEANLNAFVTEALRRHPDGYALTIIDTVGRAMEGENENAQEHASAFTALVQRLRADLGGSVLALHHTGHKEEDRARGSSVFGADPDTLVRIDRAEKEYVVTLTMTKQKDAPEWERPRYAKLTEVEAGFPAFDDGTTLVAGASDHQDLPADSSAKDDLHLVVLDRELGKILEENPSRIWTQSDLAEILAMQETIGLPEKKIKDIYLKLLRADNGTIANRCYDPRRSQKAGRWTWKGTED